MWLIMLIHGALIQIKETKHHNVKATYPKEPFDRFCRRPAPMPLAFWNRHGRRRGVLEKHPEADAPVQRLTSPSSYAPNTHSHTTQTIIKHSVHHHFFSISNYTLMDERDSRRNWRAETEAGIVFLLQILNYCRGLSDKPAYHINEFRALLNTLRDKGLLRTEPRAMISLGLFCNSIAPWRSQGFKRQGKYIHGSQVAQL